MSIANSQPRRHPLAVTARIVLVLALVIAVPKVTGCMEHMFYIPTAGPTPASQGPAGTEGVWFESADGTRLFGWFIPAQGEAASADEAPSVLHVHGNAGNILSHVWFTEHLPQAGFNVFLFDYRGYGQSEGRPRRRGPLIADTHAALDALLARGDVTASRVAIYGQSLGGAIAINVMADRPELRAGVFESPFASWREIAADVLGGGQGGVIARALASLFIPDDYRPDEAIARIQRPVLILHGDVDAIIPIHHGRRLADAAPDHAELIELPGGDHNTLRMSHEMIDQLTIDFFNEHLGPQ